MALPSNEDLRVNLIADVACEIDVEHVIVKPNGHLTVFPTLAENSGSVYVAPYLGLPENDYAALNPAVQNFLAVYEGYERTMIALLNPRYTGFFDSVVTLDWKTLTGLEIVRLAAKYKLLPDCCIHNWRGLDVPPFTIGIGDIGYALGQDWQVTWNPIEMKPAPDIQVWLDAVIRSLVLTRVAHNSTGVMDASAVALKTGGHT
ncbi:hypothetical protein FRC09_003576 [Ceratobasidium sp. 395]|nr:hypothetical protein FRC09_003576 [Ceratobasidium sp. 395]